MINSYNNTFVSCNSSFNTLFGYQIFEISSNNTFIDCIAHNNSQHGWYVRGDNNTFNGCEAYYNAGDMRPFPPPYWPEPRVIPIPTPWYYGIQVSGDNNTFVNCEVYEEFTGIQITGDYNNFTDSNAHHMANGYYGWWCDHYSKYNRIENCLTYNISHGITLTNYTTVINHTAYNGIEGVLMGDYAYILVENSTSYNMLSDGFVVAGQTGSTPYYTNNVLRNNTAFNCSGPAFGFGMNSAGVTVENCTAYDSYYGFGFYENASYITLTDCSVYNNSYDFSFGYNSKAMTNIDIINTPSSGTWRLQHSLTHNITVEVISGVLNCTTTNININAEQGSFTFTAANDAQLQINYTLVAPYKVSVRGDLDNTERSIGSTTTITVETGNNVAIWWWPYVPFSMIDSYFMLGVGLTGIILMIAGPTIFARTFIKHGLDDHSIMWLGYAMLFVILGFGFTVVWLWPG